MRRALDGHEQRQRFASLPRTEKTHLDVLGAARHGAERSEGEGPREVRRIAERGTDLGGR